MRTLLVSALALLASPILAQSHLADSSGVYAGLEIPGMMIPFIAVDAPMNLNMRGRIGYRQSNGLDYGLHTYYFSQRNRNGRSLIVGPEAGYTLPLNARTFVRFEATGSYEMHRNDYDYFGGDLNTSALAATASAGLGRNYAIGGSVAPRPTLGVYAELRHTLSWQANQDVLAHRPDRAGDTDWVAGWNAQLPLSFRLFGNDMTLTTAAVVPLLEIVPLFEQGLEVSEQGLAISTDLRINF